MKKIPTSQQPLLHSRDNVKQPSAAEEKNIVKVAAGAGQFNTLVAAVKAGGLVETFNGTGPFTVFAPTDEAFAKLPKGTVENLLKPENKEQLVAVLTYHVVPGKIMAADVATGEAKTVNGKELPIKVSRQGESRLRQCREDRHRRE